MNMNLKILDLIGKRLVKGEKRYGKENIASDGRDFVQESLEEALDCAVYLAGHIIELQEHNQDILKEHKEHQQCTGDNVI